MFVLSFRFAIFVPQSEKNKDIMNKETTIAAISTAPGVGGIAVARVSGPEAIHHVNKIFRPRRKGTSLLTQPGGTVLFGTLAQPGGEVLDEVVVTVFRAPHT